MINMVLVSYIFFIFSVLTIFCVDYFRFKRTWYDPLYFYLFFIVIYVSPLSIRYILGLGIGGNITYMFHEIEHVFPLSLVLVSVSNFVFYLFYRLNFLKLNISNRGLIHKTGAYKYLTFSGTFLFIFGFSLFFYMTSNNGGVLNFLLLGYGVTSIFSEQPLLATSIPITFVSGLFFFYAFIESGRKINIVLSIVVSVSFIIICIVLGRRAEVVSWGLVYLLNIVSIYKKIRFIKLVPLFIAAFIFMNLLGVVRQSNYQDLNSFFKRIEDKAVGDNSSSYNMFYTLTDGQFAVPFEVLPVLMEKLELNEFKYGSTLIESVQLWIPRFLWHEKGHGLTSWYYHKYYDPSAPPNEGRAFFFLAEGYLNFGVVGVLFWAALWGQLCRFIGSLYLRSNDIFDKNYLGIFFFSVFTGNMIKLMAGSLSSIFVVLIKQTILWFMIGLFVAYLCSQFNKLIRFSR